MSKPTPKTVSTELVIAGQPSAAILADLKAAGEKLTIEQLAGSLAHLEQTRAGFVTEAVATGLLLLAKKQTLKHGEWQPFLAEVWAKIQQTGNGVSPLPPDALHNFVRSLRGYTFLAQHFIADLEQGSFPPEDRDLAVLPPAVTPKEVLALDTLPQEKRVAVYGAIERFVAGRSLRRMLIDFRRAENASDQEEAEEATRKAKRSKPGDPAQIDFFEDMMRPIGEIDIMFEDKSLLRKTDRKFWLGVAEKLAAQAQRARQIAKEIAE